MRKTPAKKAPAKKAPAKKAAAKKAPARKASAPKKSGPEQVAEYLKQLEHPLKAEIEAVREIILGANRKIAERVKWNAPSFYYQEDLAAFHLRPRDYVHVVFVFPQGTMPEDRFGFLEGDYKDRRLARFHSMAEVQAHKAGLVKLVNHWVRAVDKTSAARAHQAV